MTDDLVLAQLADALRGRYRPIRLVGRGSSAAVYLATDVAANAPVAVKVLQQVPGNPTMVERFRREIAILSRLSHPNIVPLFESGDAHGMPYYITAYVPGHSLRRRMLAAGRGGLPVAEALDVADQVASGLDYAHGRNVLHRDVKPENILIDDTHAMLADFGIARALQLMEESSITATGVALGTPAYMSPEQLNADRSVDGRADVYGLGCVVFEMLAGVPPFVGRRGVVDNTLKFRPEAPRLSEARAAVPPPVDAVFASALALDPSERFPTAGAFAAALREAHSGR